MITPDSMELLFVENLSRILPDFKALKYVIGVSGGVDSMVLADLMSRLVPAQQIVIAHFNHLLRGEESEKDRALVLSFAQKRAIPFESEERKGQKVSEDALRQERMEFLEKVRTTHGCDFIVVAHHLQDQLETFLMRLLRGTGLDGLTVIQPKSGFYLRPFLNFSKESILREARNKGIPYREDLSNFEPKYFRNRVRLAVLPELEKLSIQYGGKEKWMERLPLLFEELSWAKKELNHWTLDKLANFFIETPFWIRIDHKQFETLTLFEKKRVVRWGFKRLDVEPISQKEMKLLIERLQQKVKRFSVPGLDVVYSCGYVYFSRREAFKKRPLLEFRVCKDGVDCPTLEMRVRLNKPMEAVQWRQCLPGDRFEGKKLKEYFLEERIPRPERELIPVLAKENSNEVLWFFPKQSSVCTVEKIQFPFVVKG